MSSRGQSLELFFIDGKPDGMLTAEVFNWIGHVLVTPRTQISEALRRKEARHTGIYLLLGETENGSLAYIGEGEDIAQRIRSHDGQKEWWTKAVLITTGTNNLNKAHVKYLEARLVERAARIDRIHLDNGTTPALPGLSEAAQANMEAFLEYLFLVLPAIGIDIFVSRIRPSFSTSVAEKSDSSARIIFEIFLRKLGITATACLEEGEFVVQAGSLARKEWVGKGFSSYSKLFEELVRSGILIEEGERRKFAENYAFASPSAAGAIVTGRSCRGPVEWTVQGSGETYQDWEQERLAENS